MIDEQEKKMAIVVVVAVKEYIYIFVVFLDSNKILRINPKQLRPIRRRHSHDHHDSFLVQYH